MVATLRIGVKGSSSTASERGVWGLATLLMARHPTFLRKFMDASATLPVVPDATGHDVCASHTIQFAVLCAGDAVGSVGTRLRDSYQVRNNASPCCLR